MKDQQFTDATEPIKLQMSPLNSNPRNSGFDEQTKAVKIYTWLNKTISTSSNSLVSQKTQKQDLIGDKIAATRQLSKTKPFAIAQPQNHFRYSMVTFQFRNIHSNVKEELSFAKNLTFIWNQY